MPKAADTLFIIPARGGSKGIPGKNVKDFCGRPLIHYAIEQARQLGADSHVIVSTDSEKIAEVARQTGLAVDYRRPDALGSDTTGSREVMLDVMDWADARGLEYDRVCLLQPTSPLRTVDDIRRCLDAYSSDLDMVVSVVETSANPYYNCFEENSEGFLSISKGDGCLVRRQDAPKVWEYSGAVYVINPRSLRKHPLGLFARRKGIGIDRERAVDLDTELDWIIAETICRASSSN
ncbi:MAG: acylneuraminate cytidylyltransferase family protein [Paramuribaculum sp.]|nr:acylneuraminate cytidylyltransferase family protein [Paramuribaculum sp.]